MGVHVFRILYVLLPMVFGLSHVCRLWSLLWYGLLPHVRLLSRWHWRLCRSLRRLLRRPHGLLLWCCLSLLPAGCLCGHRSLRLWRILRCRLRLLWHCSSRLCLRCRSLVHQVEQAALVHRLCLFRHHFVNLLLVLRLGIEACLSERGDGILVVLGGNQFLRLLEMLLIFLAFFLFLLRFL